MKKIPPWLWGVAGFGVYWFFIRRRPIVYVPDFGRSETTYGASK